MTAKRSISNGQRLQSHLAKSGKQHPLYSKTTLQSTRSGAGNEDYIQSVIQRYVRDSKVDQRSGYR
jgi:hypothetical protein